MWNSAGPWTYLKEGKDDIIVRWFKGDISMDEIRKASQWKAWVKCSPTLPVNKCLYSFLKNWASYLNYLKYVKTKINGIEGPWLLAYFEPEEHLLEFKKKYVNESTVEQLQSTQSSVVYK